MDNRKIIEILRATIDPNQRQKAEDHLTQVHKIIGFAPTLLQILMQNDVEMPVRQAGVIYLKNLVTQYWQDREHEPGQPMPFSIHEQDRAMVRDSIVDAVVLAPDLIRVQLAVCVNQIVKHDFPARWTTIVDKVSIFLQNPTSTSWMGALLCLYQLVKNFEYKNPEDRTPLTEAMQLLMPIIYQRCLDLLPDPSENSVGLQKQIIKIYFALIQYNLPMELVTKEVFSQWMNIVTIIVDRPVPEATNQIDEDERHEVVWWKCKKWALHILTKVFERYGSPGNVTKEYKTFATYYLDTFSGGVIEVILKTLDQHRQKIYVAPRVVQLSLMYLNSALGHGLTWKFLKSHMTGIMRELLFPLMSYTDQDDELWTTDPHEYIRMKFDIFEDFFSPVTAAQTLLHTAAKKRKDMLQSTMQFAMSVLTNPASDPRQKDGALHMIGTLADILLKKQVYKDQMEMMLVAYVYPEFQSPHPYMRARACWILHYFCEIKFKDDRNLAQALQYTQNCLLNDKELPVRVEAAIALQMLITNQDRAQPLIEPNVTPITLELLKIIRETENDDLTNVLQKLVCTYSEQLTPIAFEMTQHLATTFIQVLESDEGTDEKAITAMGLLNTIETILTVMEDQQLIIGQLEGIVLNVVGQVLTRSVTEFFEEIFSLVYSLTCNRISQDMWKVLEMMYQVFEKDGVDYFTDMMPALHNYVTVDTPAFVSNQNHLLAMFNMAKIVLTGDSGEDAECHAAKLLEVIILQCKGQIDQCIPSFVQLVLERLTREVRTSELRTMCLQVVISALYYNPQLLLQTLEHIQLPNVNDSIFSQFVKQWIHDTDCFLGLHDRKVCVLGLCTLLTMGMGRPAAVNECASMIVPSLILLFEGLKRAYAHKAQNEQSDSDDDEDEDEDADDAEVLGSDEDEIDEKGNAYLESLQKKVLSANSPFPITATIKDESEEEDDDDEEVDDDIEETALESYTTPLDDEDCPIDEYWTFKEVLLNLQNADPAWYNTLTAHLTPDQNKTLRDIIVLADQRRAAAESKRIEQSGGYQFDVKTVPTTFNFGGNFGGTMS